jgi:hypothetical protein
MFSALSTIGWAGFGPPRMSPRIAHVLKVKPPEKPKKANLPENDNGLPRQFRRKPKHTPSTVSVAKVASSPVRFYCALVRRCSLPSRNRKCTPSWLCSTSTVRSRRSTHRAGHVPILHYRTQRWRFTEAQSKAFSHPSGSFYWWRYMLQALNQKVTRSRCVLSVGSEQDCYR